MERVMSYYKLDERLGFALKYRVMSCLNKP